MNSESRIQIGHARRGNEGRIQNPESEELATEFEIEKDKVQNPESTRGQAPRSKEPESARESESRIALASVRDLAEKKHELRIQNLKRLESERGRGESPIRGDCRIRSDCEIVHHSVNTCSYYHILAGIYCKCLLVLYLNTCRYTHPHRRVARRLLASTLCATHSCPQPGAHASRVG